MNTEPKSLLHIALALIKDEKAGVSSSFVDFQTYIVQLMSLTCPTYMDVFLNQV